MEELIEQIKIQNRILLIQLRLLKDANNYDIKRGTYFEDLINQLDEEII